MRMAVFSDVHANLPALEAVLRDIKKQKPDLICCLGDLVNQNVWNREVIELIRSQHIPTLMGNHDQGIGNHQSLFPYSYSTREEKGWGREAIAYTIAQTSAQDKAYLRNLPEQIRFDFPSADGRFSVLLVHGSPRSLHEYVYHFINRETLRGLLEDAGTQVLLMGHTHHPYHTIIPKAGTAANRYLHAINVGSVGCPKDGDWYSSYALLDWESGDAVLSTEAGLKVSIRRVEYDIDAVVHAIQRSPLPLFYAGRLIKY